MSMSVLISSHRHVVEYVHKPPTTPRLRVLDSTGRIVRVPISSRVDRSCPSRAPSSRGLSCCSPTFYRSRRQPQVAHVLMSQFSQSLPANDSNGRICVHLQFHGVKMHSQLSGDAFRSHGLLSRHACGVQICFPRAHRDNGLVFAPAAKQTLTVTNVSR